MSYNTYKNDPRTIKAKFESTCKETGKTIEVGEECVYYPSSREVFHPESKTAEEYRNWKFDVQCLGQNY